MYQALAHSGAAGSACTASSNANDFGTSCNLRSGKKSGRCYHRKVKKINLRGNNLSKHDLVVAGDMCATLAISVCVFVFSHHINACVFTVSSGDYPQKFVDVLDQARLMLPKR